MRSMLSFSAILAVALTAGFAGFIWWVPVLGTIALTATSEVWAYSRRVLSLGDAAVGAIPIYLQSLANAAIAQFAATALGLAAKMVWGI